MSGHVGTPRGSSRTGKKRKRVSGPPTPTRPKSPLSKIARANYNVLLVGFAKEKAKQLQSEGKLGITFQKHLSSETSHIVLNPPKKNSRNFSWNPLYYAIISGCWILRDTWLTKSEAKRKIEDEDSHTFNAEQFPLTVKQNSMKKIMELYERYKQFPEDGNKLFSNDVFKRVLILSKGTECAVKERANLRSIIEAGGGKICTDKNVLNSIRSKPVKAKKLVTFIIIVSGTLLSDLKIKSAIVEEILKQRIPILCEDFITRSIQYGISPTLDEILKQTISYWCNDAGKDKLELSPETIQSIVPGYMEDHNELKKPIKGGASIESSIRSRRKTRSQRSYLGHECVSNKLSEDDEANLLEEITKEIILNEEKCGSATMAPPEVIEWEREQQRIVIYDDPIMKQDYSNSAIDEFGLDNIDLASDNPDEVFGKQEALAWNEWMAMLKYSVPKAIARRGVETGSQSEESCGFFDAVIAEMDCHKPSTIVHDLVCYGAVNFIRHSIHDLFLPPPSTLSLLLHKVAMQEFGEQFDVTSSVYRLLTYFLHQFPPSNAEGRYYWLQVLTHVEVKASDIQNKKPKKNLSHGDNLQCRVIEFRKLVLNSFTGNGSSQQLMELVVHVLEADLFGMEGCGGLDKNQEVVNKGGTSEMSPGIWRSSLEPLNCSADLDGIPLAYLVFYDYNERRKRGLDQYAIKTCTAVVDLITDKRRNMFITNLCCRFLCVCLEAVRLFLSEVTKVFHGKCIPHDLQTDIERVARHFITRGFSRQDVLQLMPVDWIHDIVKSMQF